MNKFSDWWNYTNSNDIPIQKVIELLSIII